MIETQLAHIAASIPVVENGKIPRQPEAPVENVSMVSTEWGNPSRWLPRCNNAGRNNPPKNDSWDGLVTVVQEDPGVSMISCSIYDKYYKHATCDLGSSINIMPKVIFEELQYPALSPTSMLMQLADLSVRYPKGVVKNMLVQVRDSFVLANFE